MKERDCTFFGEIKEYIDQNGDQTPRVRDLCLRFGLNRNKLQIGFQQLAGKPIRSYLIGKKMEQAALRLRRTTDSIKMMSIDAGYRSQSNFGRVFKKHFKRSPVEYRNEYLKPMTLK